MDREKVVLKGETDSFKTYESLREQLTETSFYQKILKEEVKKLKVPVVDLIQIQTNDPFKVLVATILSARTKDETTVQSCKKLFAKVKKFEDFDNTHFGR